MRFEQEGVSLWYGTPDAPAPGPGEAVHVGSDITITVGVRPIDTSNRIEVLYRTNQGPTKNIAANWLRNDFSGRAQYFSAHLPSFQAGDMVEYTVICRFAGRQVPSSEEAKQFASSFRVIGPEFKPTLNLTTKEELLPRNEQMRSVRVPEIEPGQRKVTAVKQETSNSVDISEKTEYKVHGTIRDAYQRPLEEAKVKVFDKDIRSEQPLGGPVYTDEAGTYEVEYTQVQFATTDKLAADIIVRVYDQDGKLLQESATYYNAPQQLQVDLDLSGKAYQGPSEFVLMVKSIKPFTGTLPLAQLQEDQQTQDITFLTNKTGLARDRIEALVIAFHFEEDTKIAAHAYYGLIRQGLPGDLLTQFAASSPVTSFASRMSQTFDGLMRESTDSLMSALQQAIDANTIPYSVTAELPGIKDALIAQQQRYLQTHPQAGATSDIQQKLTIAGLQGEETTTFLSLFTANTGTQSTFWSTLAQNPAFEAQKTARLQSVFELSALTGEQIVLTEQLVKTQNIQTPADLTQLAAHTSQDWASILQNNQIQPPAGIPGKNDAEKLQNYAAELEQNFTKKFPSAAFAARIQNDSQSKIPNKDAIARFLTANPDFDLLTGHIGQFLQLKSGAKGNGVPNASTPLQDTQFVNQLRRTQRAFKLSPTYAATNTLLGDNIDSARKIYQMGQNNFVNKYGPKLGVAEAKKIFQRATTVHSQALALIGNLKSMADASHINVFPDYSMMILESMTVEVPDLDTLFGHSDFCECDECRSVYGAAAYLTDALHYLDKRLTSIQCAVGQSASVKDALLRRRPDIGDIDLECANTNTTLPYIDIVNEVLEDFIKLPAVTLNSSFLPKFVAGPIDGGLYSQIVAQFKSAQYTNIAALLTTNATISEKYQAQRFQNDDTCISEDHWIIRDQFVVLKATDHQASGISLQLLHQTLLSSDEISANSEYVNLNTYNILKAAKRPFSLPFDLFETEGELYLEKLGTRKADLIDAFRKEHDTSGPPTQADLDMAFAYLNVNEKERTLIFQQDLLNQSTYWGTLASGTSVELDLFQNATGLTYEQVLELLNLTSINPARDSVIVSDDLSCDTNKKHISNFTPTKFDIIHRFLRLWKKTTLTLEELDAIVQAPTLGNGAILPTLAWQLQAFLHLQRLWSFSVFQLLALYQNIDTTAASATAATDSLYNQLFQNRAVTNPLNPDFAITQVTAVNPMPVTDIHKGLIVGALGIVPADLDTLIAKTDAKLSLGNLSYFYRMVQLSQALSLSITDLLVFLDLITVPPFKDPVTTYQFNSKWRTVVSSQFVADDLNYVLRHHNDGTGTLITSDDLVAVALSDLQGNMLQVRAATSVQDDPKGQLLKQWLVDPLLNWNSHIVDKLMDILSTRDDIEYQQKIDNNDDFLLNLRIRYHDQVLTADLSDLPTLPGGISFQDALPGSLASQISYDAANKQLQLIGYISANDQAALLGISGSTSYQSAVNQLFNAQQTSNTADNIFFATAAEINTNLRSLLSDKIANRYKLFLSKISPVYTALQQQSLIQKEICTWFKINKDVATAIEASQSNIYTDFTDDTFVNKVNPLTPANYAAQFNWYQKIAKICFIVGKLKLTSDDLTWLLHHAADINSLDFWKLPITEINGPITTFDSFEVLVNVLKFEQRFPAVQAVSPTSTTTVSVYTVLKDVIDGDTLPNIEADLSALTGWTQEQLDQFINTPTNYLNLTLAPSASSDLKDIRILLRLLRCFNIMSSMRVKAADCVDWIKPSLTYDDAVKIKQTLKAQYEGNQWLNVTQPLQDKLREAKRDALVAYLLTNPPSGQVWQNSDDLYSFFLLDVEMSSCLLTSRIVQATNSVQLFVQRCFLNLEKEITVDIALDQDWTQWQWMKNFRLWQANRKVFLYPENWIEPELLPRTIKSSFFKDLENDLLQNDVTKDTVETAFLNYLEKLDGVSRLEVKVMWYEDAKKTLHVVARTYGGDPKTYYYRQFIENRRWTPWVKIDQDIASDHIVLTVFNDRLYLFWAMFSEKSREVDSVSLPNASQSPYTVDKPPKYWQIQMAFTEYKNGKWTPKKVSNDDKTGWIIVNQGYDSSSGTFIPDKSDFIFTPLDIPAFDIKKYFNSDGTPKDPKNFMADIRRDTEAALSGNGDLCINCYLQDHGYYNYVGTFDLDPCKGYPLYLYHYEGLRITLFDRSNFNNMLDTEEQPERGDQLSINSAAIVRITPGTFRNLVPLQMGFFDRLINIIYRILNYKSSAILERELPVTVGTFMPFFHQDQTYTYFVQPELSDDADFEFTYSDLEDLFMAVLEGDTNKVQEILATFPRGKRLFFLDHFYNFYHPLVCFFIRTLYNHGIDGLMSRDTQLKGDVIFDNAPGKFDFKQTFDPTALVYTGSPITYNLPGGPVTDQFPGYPKEDVDFNMRSGYSMYNWELFFHAPLMIAERLSQNLQFEDADRWFRYIFNPTDGSTWPSPDKYWVTKPFFINVNDKYTQQRIENIMLGINTPEQPLVDDVTDWRNNPFQPHYIAEYRTVAYQKTTVMKYLDHLIAWGDSLYTQYTMESVAEATQLYILAAQILGSRPQVIPPAYQTPVDNYYQLENKLDAFSNALVDIENLLPLQEIAGYDGVVPTQQLPNLETLYFCIPLNDKLMGYWDTVADRLFKIRHCLNIEGKLVPLALFAPPIDPGLLVRAAAAGLDIGSILSDMNSPLPNYRFSVMILKAVELCNEVKSLGSALLQAMEKKDAEDMALLRSTNGISLLNAVLTVKQKQVDDATHTLEGLQKQKELVQIRSDYYQGLITAGLNRWETIAQALTQTAIVGEMAAVEIEFLGNILALIPGFSLGVAGFGGSPTVTVSFGGEQLGAAMRAMAGAIRGTAGVMHSQAGVSSTQATYERRKQEWQFQLNTANKELEQLDKQILGAQVKLDIANQDLQNQQLQITHAQSEDDFMHNKFSNTDLYAWMIGQISTIYFQSYQLAYTLTRQAEQTFRYELALGDSSYITFGYWDSLKKGLLAGDKLMLDIRTMEKAYHDQNMREYELTKHISLSQLDPSALLLLKTSGECWVNLPEELFDMDYPGHYMRRVKSLSLTIPCVVGPYTTISCTLTMTRNSMRVSNIGGDPTKYSRKVVSGVPADDPRFRDAVGSIQSIAISSAQNDNGLFEMNFRDERYLPFEGAGAISQWHLKLPAAVKQFDYSTISDVVMHLKYTSRDGGDMLLSDATKSLNTKINTMLVALKDTGLMRVFSARHEFPTQWYAFLNPASASDDQVLNLNIGKDRFPYFASVAPNLKIRSVELVADSSLASINGIQVTPTPLNTLPLNMTADGYYNTMLRLILDYSASKKDPGTWKVTNVAANPRLTSDQINDLIIIIHYEIS